MVALIPRLALALAALAVAAQPALAAPKTQHNPHGKFLGVVKHRGGAASPGAAPPSGNLTYHNGPVMHTNRTHAIFWGPSGSFTSTYVSIVTKYFTDVAHDSGLRGNVFSTNPQYTDTTGAAAYSSTFGGAITDTNAYPASGCPAQGSRCLTDAQLQTEVDHVISTTQGLSRGLGDIYFVYTPTGVDSCFGSSSSSCSYNVFCAYHSDFQSSGVEVLYADMPFPDLTGCDSHQHPNGDAAADSVLNVTSHEHNETVTDPTGLGWWDPSTGDEDGDKCNFGFGTAIGTAPNGASYNQTINGGLYYLQREWSNSDAGCVQREDHPPVAHIGFSPSAPTPGQQVSFDGTTSTDSDGTIGAYSWSFGDGSTSTASQPTHTYASAGTYTVSLTVTDNDGVANKTSTSVLADSAPSCSATSANILAGSSGSVSLTCSDADAGDTIIRSIVSGPSHGTLSAINQGAGTVTYTPASGYFGPDSFTFRATDNHNRQSAAATATLNVNTTKPTCSDTSATVAQDGSAVVSLPCGGNGISRAIVNQPSHGTLGNIDQTAGTVAYTPNPGYSGPDSFTFDSTDGTTTSAPSTASITVQPPPPPPPSPPAGGGSGSGSQPTPPFNGTPNVGSPPVAVLGVPHVSDLHLSPRSIRRAAATLVRWLLDLPATTAFRVERVLPGVVSGGRCVKPRAGDSRRHCRRFSTVRSFSLAAGVAGRNTLRVSSRGLAPGLYRLTAIPTDASGHAGSPVRTSFIVTR